MRIRLILIVAALALLAYAGLGDDGRSTDPHRNASSGQVAGQPAPDPAVPAIGSAAAKAASTVKTLPHATPRRHVPPAPAVFTLTAQASALPDVTTRPRSFPLLI